MQCSAPEPRGLARQGEESQMAGSPPTTTSLWIALASVVLALAVPAEASADKLAHVKRLDAREDGAATIVTIRGTATPTFTVYKLEKPERVVVDLANAALDADEDGPRAV